MGNRKLDKIVVVDIEACCWKGNPPPGQHKEIIEVGICTVDLEKFIIEDVNGILVRPIHSRISKFCTELTGLTQEIVDEGYLFMEACKKLREDYKTKRRIWGSWGNADRTAFTKMCKLFQVRYPFTASHINIKTLFALMNPQFKKEQSMKKALNAANIPLEGQHHSGKWDAYNTAKLLITLLKRGKE